MFTKRFKNLLKSHLMVSERFQVYVYSLMLKKHFMNIRYQNFFTENVYQTFQETRFYWKRFSNSYKIAEEMKDILEMFFKHSS